MMFSPTAAFHEARRRNDLTCRPAASSPLTTRAHAAPVVGMAVRIDHRALTGRTGRCFE